MTVDVLSREERVARARLALAHAERRTGARSVLLHERPVAAVPTVPETAVPEPAAAAVPVAPEPTVHAPQEQPVRAPGVLSTALLTTERPALPVPPAIAPLLPDGLRRGATTAVLGSTSLALALLASASAAGSWAAVVGQPALGLLAAAESGVVLDRLAVVPHPGPDAALVLSALLDGVDVVVVGPQARLVDADRRRLSARARERGAVLLATTPWPGAQAVLTAERGAWSGLGDGHGRLRTHLVRVARAGRSGAGVPLALDLTFPLPVPGQDTAVAAAAPRAERRAPALRLVG
ncbi:hypothetical protein ACT17Q_09090 [Cellulomonas sp. CW35]|uniref:hypothetical protein n=1 Tax=Cellulomonas sp. CW35 TaxID=3458249 RepID=UPI0040337EFE